MITARFSYYASHCVRGFYEIDFFAMKWQWKVPSDAASDRADRLILSALASGQGIWSGPAVPLSRNQVQRLIDEGKITADGAPIQAKSRLKEGVSVLMEIPPPSPVSVSAENRPIEILFEDPHIAVINKPPGLTVHPSPTQSQGTLVNLLLHHIKDLSGIGGELRPGIVHRLDKDTSGALVITKTDAAHRKLSEVFSRHEIERVYWAFCYGSPREAHGKIESFLGRNPRDRKKIASVKKGGRKAITHFRKIVDYFALGSNTPFASWLELRLETGRTHQIRVHLTVLGNSVLGDPVYGTPLERQAKWLALPVSIQSVVRLLPGQALHARVLGFKHPITGEKLQFEAEVPEAFGRLHRELELLRK